MKVKELIEKLQKADPEAEAVISVIGEETAYDVTEVWTEDWNGKMYLYIGQIATATRVIITEL